MSATTIIVNDETPRRQYTATGGQTVFDFPFPFFENGDLEVYKTPAGQTADDINDILTITSDYTVTGADTQNGGKITLTSGAAAGDIITILRVVDIDRTADYQAAGDLLAETLNREQDTEIMISQQLREEADRSMRLQKSDIKVDMRLPALEDRRDTILQFDTNGEPTVVSPTQFVAGLSGAIIGANYITNNATGDGTTVNFTLSSAPGSKGNLQIYIDGVYQNKATFSLAGTTVTFTEAPPLNASVEFIIGYSIGSTNDAGDVSFTQQGTGASTRTVEAKLYEFVSVKDFGAKGDGVTDDTASIQAAITSVSTDGGKVIFPPTANSYAIDSNITVPSNVDLEFHSGALISGITGNETLTINGTVIAGSHQIFASTVTVSGLDKNNEINAEWWGVTPTSAGDASLASSNTVALNAALLAGAGKTVVLLGDAYHFDDEVYVSSFSHFKGNGETTYLYHNGDTNFITFDPALTGIGGARVSDFRIVDNIKATRTSGSCIYFKGNRNIVERARIFGFVYGVHFEQTYVASINNVRAESAINDGFLLAGTSTSVTYKNCYAQGNGRYGFSVTGSNAYLSYIGTASDNNSYGYHIDGTSTVYSKAVSFTSTGAETNTNANYKIKNGFGFVFTTPLSLGSVNGFEFSGARKINIYCPHMETWSGYAIKTSANDGIDARDIAIDSPQWSSYGVDYFDDSIGAITLSDEWGGFSLYGPTTGHVLRRVVLKAPSGLTTPGTLVTLPSYESTLPGLVSVPATASSSGIAGQMAYASGYLYVCVATNTWQRVALTTF